MFRRLAVVGGPSLLLILGTILVVRYRVLILDTVWDGALPVGWHTVIVYLPMMLAAAGILVGLRMRSCGVLIVMLTLAVAVGMVKHDGTIGNRSLELFSWRSPLASVWMSVNFLLGLWTMRYSWRSRRGMGAQACVLLWTAGFCVLANDIPMTEQIRSILQWVPKLPGDWADLLRLGQGGLPVLIVVGYLVGHALWFRDPVAAGLSASLMLNRPIFTEDLDGVFMAITCSAAVLAVLAGILESMMALAYRDGLTGLPDRRALNDMLRQLGRRYAVAMLDVDHFKRFNDRFGHRTGDDVLKMIAARMQRIPGGRPFRYGGEEFAVVFSGRSSRQAIERMEIFRETLARNPFVIRGLPRSNKKARGQGSTRLASRQRVKVTVSVGVALPGEGCRKAADVMTAADKALYRAKKTGRNRVATHGVIKIKRRT